MINPRALKLFHIVVDKGSLAAASDQFNLSPPAASRLISLLEDDLGFRLFSREGRNLVLTKNGRRFWRESQPILSNYESIEKIAGDIRKNALTSLRVLSTSPIATSWIAPALGRLQTLYPTIACNVEIVDRLELQSNVGNRSHDIAIGSLPIGNNSSHLKTQALCSFRFEAALRKEHPLAKMDVLTADQIASYPVIGLYRGQIGRVRSDEFFQSHGLSVTPQFETSSSIVSLALCRQNLGIALVPSVYLQNDDEQGLVGRAISPERWISFAAITAAGQELSEVQSAFIRCLKTAAGQWDGTKLDGENDD